MAFLQSDFVLALASRFPLYVLAAGGVGQRQLVRGGSGLDLGSGATPEGVGIAAPGSLAGRGSGGVGPDGGGGCPASGSFAPLSRDLPRVDPRTRQAKAGVIAKSVSSRSCENAEHKLGLLFRLPMPS